MPPRGWRNKTIQNRRSCTRCGKTHSRKQKDRNGEMRITAYCLRCKNDLQKKRREDNLKRGLCFCGRPVIAGQTRCVVCRKREIDHRIECREKVLNHYGRTCFCCSEHRLEFLTVDHISGGGNQHKKERKTDIYIWLVLNKFPEGYRTACFNCNCARGRCGYCPHEYELR